MRSSELKIINIVLLYKNENEVIQYAEELSKQTIASNILLFIVVNKYSDEKNSKVFKERLSVCKVPVDFAFPNENLGYLNGLMYGFNVCKNKYPCSWFVLSNTDILISSLSCFERFLHSVKFYQANNCYLIGPSVYLPSEKAYMPPYLLKRPKRSHYLFKNFILHFPFIHHAFSTILRKKRVFEKPNSGYIYAVHGCFMFVHRDVLIELSNRPKWVLLYDEEQYIAEITYLLNKKVYFDSELEVGHINGASTKSIELRRKYKLLREANKRLLKDFY